MESYINLKEITDVWYAQIYSMWSGVRLLLLLAQLLAKHVGSCEPTR